MKMSALILRKEKCKSTPLASRRADFGCAGPLEAEDCGRWCSELHGVPTDLMAIAGLHLCYLISVKQTPSFDCQVLGLRANFCETMALGQ